MPQLDQVAGQPVESLKHIFCNKRNSGRIRTKTQAYHFFAGLADSFKNDGRKTAKFFNHHGIAGFEQGIEPVNVDVFLIQHQHNGGEATVVEHEKQQIEHLPLKDRHFTIADNQNSTVFHNLGHRVDNRADSLHRPEDVLLGQLKNCTSQRIA